MKPTEHTANTATAPKTGFFATLAAFLQGQGSSAPRPTGVNASLLALCSLLTSTMAIAAVALPATASGYAAIEGPPIYSSAPGLPDGRVYEQVSPPNKNGNEAGATTDPFITGAAQRYGYAAPEGNSVLFEGSGPMGESPAVDSLEFVATHSTGGWTTRALEPTNHVSGKPTELLFADADYLDPSPDLSHAMVATDGSLASPRPNEGCRNQMYLTGPDPFLPAQWLEQPAIVDPIENCESYNSSGAPVGGTPNFSTVYFTYPGTLLPEDASRAPHAHKAGVKEEFEAWGFYEYTEGVLHEAGVLPDGSLSPFGAAPAASVHGRALTGNQVSASGLRAFFVSPDPASCEQNEGENNCTLDPPELYVRENGIKTVLVSQSQLPGNAGDPAPSGPLRMPNPTLITGPRMVGSYVFASPDGSHAFFQSEDQLTSDAPVGPPGNTSPKTYDFDVDTGELTYLPDVTGQIVVTDTDGSSLAFVRPAAGGAPAELDLWSEGANGGTVTPITQLPGSQEMVTEARMSSDGSVVVFATGAQIAGFHNGGIYRVEAGYGTGEFPIAEIYRYDVPTNTLGCVSCTPAGVTPTGPAAMSSLLPTETYERYTPNIHGMVDSRGTSSNGDRIFFDSPDPLVPQDTNTDSPEVTVSENELSAQGRDVYEWENGVVYLISGGKSPRDSYLLDNSENGDDVFFATTESLVPGDTDGGYDVYDARVPHPGDNPPAAAVPCEGSVCQGPPNVPSPLTPPASATFSGLGNSTPEPVSVPAGAVRKKASAKCRKGYAKNKKGKCVKQKARKKAKNASDDRRTK